MNGGKGRFPLGSQSNRRAGSLASQRLSAIFVAWALAVLPAPAAAQDLFGVVVKVNDAIISGYDLDQRKRLVALGAPSAPPTSVEQQAMEMLIGDQLKLQEAERIGVTVAEDEIDDAMNSVARRNRQSLEQLTAALDQAGVTQDTFRAQLRAEIAWNELIRRRYGGRVSPSDAEVDAALEQVTGDGATRYDVRQIVVALSPDAAQGRVQRAFEEAQRVRRELKDCGQITRLAPRYSKISGTVGNMTAEQMPGPVRAAVTPLQVGETTKPLRSKDGVHVIMLCGKKTAAAANRQQVFDRLLQEKAGRFSESYLDDLRRTAMIESKR